MRYDDVLGMDVQVFRQLLDHITEQATKRGQLSDRSKDMITEGKKDWETMKKETE